MKTSEYELSQDELLQIALESGMINLAYISDQVVMKERKELLEKHPYKIYQGKDGKWRTYLPDKDKGRVLKKRTTKEAIEDVIIKYWKAELTDPTTEDVFNEWNKRRLDLGKIVKSSYDRDARTFKQHFGEFGKLRVKSIEPDEVEDFLEERIAECNLTAKAYSSLKRITKGLLKYAKKKKWISFPVQELFDDMDVSDCEFKRVVKEDYEEVFNDVEWDIIIPYLTENLDIWNIGLLLIFVSGLRVGELATLKHGDIVDGTVRIRRTETIFEGDDGKTVYGIKEFPKTRAGFRTVVVPTEYLWLLDEVAKLNPDEEFIFVRNGKRMTTNCFRRRLERLEKKLGIYHKSPHRIRKTYGTILLDNDMDHCFTKEQMGHSSIGVTESCYHRNRRSDDEKRQKLGQIPEFSAKQKSTQTYV